MLIHFDQSLTGRTQVFARIKFSRVFSEMLTDRRRHPQTAIRIDIDLANIISRGLAQLLFGDPDRVFEGPAMSIDDLDRFDRHGR